MMKPALQYLVLRSLGAPAVLLSLAMQGVFRGLKDTKTPLYATGIIILHFFDGELYMLGKLDSKRKLPL
jgi:Na+-driven multidrug efflux pump